MRPLRIVPLAVSVAVLLFSLRHASTVSAKVVEATHEWTLLGKNDTVAAGMHIRMDMTTGEKWVKLMEEDGTNETLSAKTASSMQVQVSGLVAADNISDKRSDENEPNYDFYMMHRTLSNLPQDELERMKLPVLPKDTLSPEARVIFERRMKEIWEERQKELRNVELADLPELLKDRIVSIREYLEDPATHLLRLIDADDEPLVAENRESLGMHIVDVLQDLEYNLQDLDMTRDFHTLGGWSLLASLLSDQVHFTTLTIARHRRSNTTTSFERNGGEASDAIDVTNHVYRVQMNAAWALGTAVKNTAEFGSYVVEKFRLVDNSSTEVTALDLVFQQLQKSMQSQEQSPVTQKKLLRLVYCLGSFLRGNRAAQIYFGAFEGPAFLSKALQSFVGGKHVFETKIATRLLNLASDAVFDVTLSRDMNAAADSSVDDAIVSAWTSAAWCTAAVSALEQPELQEAAASAVHAFAPHCKLSWHPVAVIDAVKRVQQVRDAAIDDDPEIRRERDELFASIVNELSA